MKVGPRYVVVAPHLTRLPQGPLPPAVEVKAARQAMSAQKADEAHQRMLAEQGPILWAELHPRAFLMEGRDDSEWLAAFATRLPCGVCKTHWFEMLARTPPDWTRYFAWTVDRHNEVNARLGKPALTEAPARSLWHEPGDAIATPPQAG